MTQISNSNRISYFDIARGIGFILVVIAHNAPSYVDSWIITFYMPLFFIVSGYFFKPKEEDLVFYKKRYIGLVKPYIIFVMLSIVFFTYTRLVSGKFNSDAFFKKFFALLTAHNGTGLYPLKVNLSSTGPAYFIMQMFMVTVFAKVFYKFLIKHKMIVSILVAIIILVITCISQTYLILPFKSQQAILVVPFFYYGYLLKKCNIDFSLSGRRDKVLGMLFLVFLGIVFLIFEHHKGLYISNYQGKYSEDGLLSINGMIVYIGACLISTSVIFISRLISFIPLLNKFLIYVGKNTIWLLIIHTLERQYLKFAYFNKLVAKLPYKFIYIILFKFMLFVLVYFIFQVIFNLFKKFIKKSTL